MNRDLLMGALALTPLFGLFALFLVAIYFRGRYNKAHPEGARTAAQKLRAQVIGWTALGLVLAVEAYLLLRAGRLAPSWTTTAFVGFGGFILGEAIGRRNASRRLEDNSPSSTDLA